MKSDEKKQVGILTYAYADNYGAVLQTYALRRYINKLPGYNAEIIHYVPSGYRHPRIREKQLANENLFRAKRKIFKDFLQRECGCNTEEITRVSGNEYDYYCVGSDQVWNTTNTNFFFAHLDSMAKKISYAASLGLNLDNPKLKKDFCKEYVSQFKAISVRENIHVDMMKELTGKDCVSVIDPTLLLDEEDYKLIVSKDRLREEEFIFFFWLEQNGDPFQALEVVNNLARRYNVQVVHSLLKFPSNMIYRDGGTMMYEGVENFMWYMKHAKFVVTNSYHGTIFSILFKRPFYTFLEESMRCRVDTLVEKLGIKDRVIEKYISPADYSDEINYEPIYEKILEERKMALNYLSKAIDID